MRLLNETYPDELFKNFAEIFEIFRFIGI